MLGLIGCVVVSVLYLCYFHSVAKGEPRPVCSLVQWRRGWGVIRAEREEEEEEEDGDFV